jgi:starch phosphorylase
MMAPKSLFPHLPDRISGLSDLAYNLWWSWQPDARNLFRDLGVYTWRESGHNPIRMLAISPAEVLEGAAGDKEYLQRYQEVMDRFEKEIGSPTGWFSDNYGMPTSPLAYMSAEFGLHASLPTYAGGLGILAGDHLKECSDLGVPVIGVGLIYSEGYVQQHIGEDGWQQDVETTLDRTYDPILPVLDEHGNPMIVQMPIFDPPLHVAVWKVAVGRVPLYLMDTDLDVNQPWERAIAQQLYARSPEQRLKQEIVLGMGGIEILEALGIHPAALHLNEGHPAFAILARISHAMHEGATFDEAFQQVRDSSVFTTHTPMAAGTDVFPFQLMEQYFGSYCAGLGIDQQAFMKLGIHPQDPGAGFNLTVFTLRSAKHCNAVSRRHGEVARQMWASLWPDKKPEDVPITSITNGVHLPTWIEVVQMQGLLSRYLGPDWRREQDRSDVWQGIDGIPDEEVWHLHRDLKSLLFAQIDARARRRWSNGKSTPSIILASGALLDPQVLTIGFARRFTGYKRADLIFHDLERTKRMLSDGLHPVQFVFAGIAHPADNDGKSLIQEIVRLAQDPACAGRIAFVENYDQGLAQYLVHGVDVWLNNPLPPLEASGTSGMKAAINGTPSLSILDGWWIEGYEGSNGWAFGGEAIEGDRTQADAEAVYRLLEEKIIPLYYERSDDGVPRGFVKVMKAAIKSVAPAFSARRMLKEYVEREYAEALALKTLQPQAEQ